MITKLNEWCTKQKEGENNDIQIIQAKMKIMHFAICFVHKMKKIHTLGWPLVTKGHVTP